ncbi:MAG: pyruvate ferredoxin oxidoreductase [Candidatus Aquicultor primus]|uniref:Pyruvate ferredoxin oxidoreductase n=1 Tax=Candidatus Aquicultor primus TaxID=1797195 RepID=A0A1F2UIH5_9ACTN|nr:MAG: pyruvate ferredoxin oxidoreductase [Candidatus Aquicultor primus]HCG98757.1 pyruvate ferredoxin oxidoreductase [Actinomycetota bacterium]
MAIRVAYTGNGACAQAMRQVEPHMVAAYPITPQTEVVEEFAKFVADGKVKTKFLPVESEHSAMSACIGGAAAGGRVMTTTASQGLAYMWEMLYIASGLRLPIVMGVANRALSAPINIHGDHSDTMGARDSGWVQLYCKTVQEVYDTLIQAVRIAEHDEVRLPVMVCYDGFSVSHSLMDLEVLAEEQVKGFVGSFTPRYPLLDIANPVTYGPLALYDFYFEYRRQQVEAMATAERAVGEIAEEYASLSGRRYSAVEAYRLDNAEVALVSLGSTASTIEYAVDRLRDEGVAAGALRIRTFRPFPKDAIREALEPLKAVAVMDRSESLSGWGGPVGIEVKAAFYETEARPLLLDVVYGLGGRDVGVDDVREVFGELKKATDAGKMSDPVYYLSLRE